MSDRIDSFTPDQAADVVMHLDGPYHPERIMAAADTVAELVRRLNHASIARMAFTYPSELDATLQGIKGAAYGIQQLLRQLGDQLDYFHSNDRLYSDRFRGAPDAAEQLIAEGSAAHAALDYASALAASLGDKIGEATCYTHTLGLADDQEQP